MPQPYIPQLVEGARLGLNENVRDHRPGEARVARNVEFTRGTVATMRGSRPVLLGGKDAVERGGPPGSSLAVQGHPYWTEHEVVWAHRNVNPVSPSYNYVRNSFHARHGFVVIPEADQTALSLNAKTGEPDFALAFSLWSDDAGMQRRSPEELDQPFQPIVVMSKGFTATRPYQWRVQLTTGGASLTAGRPTFALILQLADSSTFNLHNVRYTSGGSPAAFFVPGKRHWFAFVSNIAAGQMTCYYWQEGMAAPVSSVETINAAVLTNGTVHSSNEGCPLIIGGQTSQNVGNTIAFNGCVPELLLFDAQVGNASRHPTFDAGYAWYEAELPDVELVDSPGTVVGDTDLALYYSMRQASVRDTRWLDARFTRGAAASSSAWLTGADATWRAGGGIDFVPSAPHAGQRDAFYRALVDYDVLVGGYGSLLGSLNFAAGLRVPRGDAYVRRDASLVTSTSSAYQFPDAISFMVRFRVDPFDGTDPGHSNHNKRTLFQLCSVHVGATDPWDYTVTPVYDCWIGKSGANFVLRARAKRAGGYLSATGTTALVADTWYTAHVTLAWGDDSATQKGVLRIYLDGEFEAEDVQSDTRPGPSEDTATDSTGPNTNVDDGRAACFPFMLGCDIEVSAAGAVPSERSFLFGATEEVGVSTGGNRWWAFHNDYTDSRKFPDDGVAYHGWKAHRGAISHLAVWHKLLSDQEVSGHADGMITRAQAAGYGELLKSYWKFDEGRGNVAYDSGSLGNHLRLHPYPYARPMSGPVARADKPAVLSLFESRTRTPREGVKGREVYGVAGGSVVRLAKDGSGDSYLEPIAGRIQYDEAKMPRFFRFADWTFFVTGKGPVYRISRGRVTPASLSAPWSPIQQDNLGWQEGDRDGTFDVGQLDAASSAETVFNTDARYLFVVCPYDAEGGHEGPPSRIIAWTVKAGGAGHGAKALQLRMLPRPHERHATHYRIYRTVANGGTLFRVDEVPIQVLYSDTKPDIQLGSPLSSEHSNPPPQNATIARVFGERVVYGGVPDAPATVFISRAGQPEACPVAYQQILLGGRSSEMTGAYVAYDRLVVFLQDGAYLGRENGGDIGPTAVGSQILTTQPVTLFPAVEALGCVADATIQHIDTLGGALFASEEGIAFTDTQRFEYVGAEDRQLRIGATWATLKRSTYRLWHAIHHRRKTQYILFCSDGSDGDRNNLAITYDYTKDAFSVRTGLQARASWSVEDETTGENRIYVSDYLGQVFELDPPDEAVSSYGVKRAGFSAYTGTVQSVTNTLTRVRLVADGSLPTAGDGLRGVRIHVDGVPRLIAANDTEYVTLEEALDEVPTVNDPWMLGAMDCEHESGDIDPHTPSLDKKWPRVTLELEPNAGSSLTVAARIGEGDWQDFGALDAGQRQRTVAPLGRGHDMALRLSSHAPENPWEVHRYEVGWLPRKVTRW